MTALFGMALLIGIVMMLAWIAATAVAANVEGWANVDPERRFGSEGRFILAGVLGFGMAGLSSFYAGWPPPVALGASLVGAAGLVGVSIWLGPETGE
ncbi:MAG: hypothetical protein QGD89_01415 [Actinomycetota bacterium]|nr:hypothetical protein [Actinomycetota bacterium]